MPVRLDLVQGAWLRERPILSQRRQAASACSGQAGRVFKVGHGWVSNVFNNGSVGREGRYANER